MNLETMQKDGREAIYRPYEYYCEQDVVPFTSFTTPLDQHTANTWKACIDTILESGLLEEEITSGLDDALDIQSAHGHNTLARAIKELISNMWG